MNSQHHLFAVVTHGDESKTLRSSQVLYFMVKDPVLEVLLQSVRHTTLRLT